MDEKTKSYEELGKSLFKDVPDFDSKERHNKDDWQQFNKIEEKLNRIISLLEKLVNEKDKITLPIRFPDEEQIKKNVELAQLKSSLNEANLKEENVSPVSKSISEPDAIFSKSNAKMNIKSEVSVWVEKEGKYNKIKTYTETSKMDGSNKINSDAVVSKKGIMDFTDGEIYHETERYYQKLFDQGFVRNR